jgi:phage terminase large subunit
VSTYKDNQYLDKSIVDEIEYLGSVNPSYWRIYWQGEYGKVEWLVFPKRTELQTMPDNYKFLWYGQDFGFTNDPTTVVALYKINEWIVVDEVLYAKWLTNQDICVKYSNLWVDKYDEIYADSAEPKSIEEIHRLWYNIHPAEKWPDSIKFWIDLLQQHNIYVTSRSSNLKKELKTYSWKKDKNWEYLPVPIDNNNHCIDALRYVAMSKLKRRDSLISIHDDRRN